MYVIHKQGKRAISCPKCHSSYHVKYVEEEGSYYCSKCETYFIPNIDLGGAGKYLARMRSSIFNQKHKIKSRNLRNRKCKRVILNERNRTTDSQKTGISKGGI